MRVRIDFGLCQGHGTCKGEAPEVFDVDEGACRAIVLQEEPPESLHAKVRMAAKYCPTLAIVLED